MEKQFLNKDITIQKMDGKYLRGICQNENENGLTVEIPNSNKILFVPYENIIEVTTSLRRGF